MDIKDTVKKGIKALTDADYRFMLLANQGVFNKMPDEEYIRKLYKSLFHRELNLENPQTFNEKLNWLKLYYRKPIYVLASDKYTARDFVAEKIGEQYLVPSLGVWDSADEIDFDALPNEFVLKCNHNSSMGMCLCRDKSKLNIEKARKNLAKGLAENYYLNGREWQYRDIKRRIVGEKLLKAQNGLLNYKIFCFDGEPKLIYITNELKDHETGRLSFIDVDWNVLSLHLSTYPQFEELPKEPKNKAEMFRIARTLSEGLPFVRVDLYSVDGKIYFSELTFTPTSGFFPVEPPEWDYKLGELLTLPEKENCDG